MTNYNKKKSDQLGMPHGTASAKLRKTILFSLVVLLNMNVCYQCGKEIESEDELSIEHKVPWLDNDDPKATFFDLENIAFSHLRCNCAAARQPWKGKIFSKHGMLNRYDKGCRCELCKKAKSIHNKKRIR